MNFTITLIVAATLSVASAVQLTNQRTRRANDFAQHYRKWADGKVRGYDSRKLAQQDQDFQPEDNNYQPTCEDY